MLHKPWWNPLRLELPVDRPQYVKNLFGAICRPYIVCLLPGMHSFSNRLADIIGTRAHGGAWGRGGFLLCDPGCSTGVIGGERV